MADDKKDDSYIGPLFDTNAAKQIDLEDLIRDADPVPDPAPDPKPKPKRTETVTRTEVSDHMIIIGIS